MVVIVLYVISGSWGRVGKGDDGEELLVSLGPIDSNLASSYNRFHEARHTYQRKPYNPGSYNIRLIHELSTYQLLRVGYFMTFQA